MSLLYDMLLFRPPSEADNPIIQTHASRASPAMVIFRSNHASNALALAGNLPRDKDKKTNCCCNCAKRWLEAGYYGHIYMGHGAVLHQENV